MLRRRPRLLARPRRSADRPAPLPLRDRQPPRRRVDHLPVHPGDHGARLLKGVGYATCHVGKWHLNGKFNSPEHAQPNDHGFDHWFSTHASTEPHNPKLNHRLSPSTFVRNGKPVGRLQGHSAALMVDEAITWLKGLKSEQPFFLYVCFHTPHIPLAASEEFLKLYPKRNVKFADISEMDFAAGRLLKALDELGRAENTLVFFTSDNEPLNKPPADFKPRPGFVGPLHGAKFELYEGGIRIPGILRWPLKIKPGQVCSEPVHHWDLLPTVCASASVPLPADRPIDGASFLPIFEGKPVARKIPLVWMSGGWALRQGDWKLIQRPKQTELFNLKDDPLEATNLAEKEPAPERAVRDAGEARGRRPEEPVRGAQVGARYATLEVLQ